MSLSCTLMSLKKTFMYIHLIPPSPVVVLMFSDFLSFFAYLTLFYVIHDICLSIYLITLIKVSMIVLCYCYCFVCVAAADEDDGDDDYLFLPVHILNFYCFVLFLNSLTDNRVL
uniref:SJCHGC06696 protein n=1 Tax=Schistosoma japonicum TaxID=6182 RepID=Q5D8K0_SCHJA|nr:SJCHGC06696 protein [Schistosoma japonicum]